MRKAARFVGFELLWLVFGCVFGGWLWLAVASRYDEMTDNFMTANGGYPAPAGMFEAPNYLRFVFLFGPYAVSVALRLLVVAVGKLRRPPQLISN